jgi:hypothetical protein
VEQFFIKRRRLVVGMLIVTIAAAAILPSIVISNLSELPGVQGAEGDSFNSPTPRPPQIDLLAITGQPGDGSESGNSASFPGQVDPHNCTFALDYWKARPDAWPIDGLRIRSLALNKSEAVAVLSIDPADARTALLQQLVIYALNVNRGANPEVVLETVKAIGDWFEAYGSVEVIPDPALERGQALADFLLQYNMGQIGPGICPDITDTPTPAPTASPTLTSTATPSPTQTRTLPPPPPVVILTNTSVIPPTIPLPTQLPPTSEPTQPPPPTTAPTQPPTSPPPTPIPTQAPPTPVPPDPPTPTSAP